MPHATPQRNPNAKPTCLTSSSGPTSPSTWSENGTEKPAINGPCGADWLFWDIDRPDDLAIALRDARRLAGAILDRYRELDDDDLLVFLSGGKGVHVGIPTGSGSPSPRRASMRPPSCSPWLTASGPRSSSMASIYSKTRLFRAPNSRHPKTGLFKRRLALDELTHLKPEAIVELARHPEPFRVPRRAGAVPDRGRRLAEARPGRRAAGGTSGGPHTATARRGSPRDPATFIRDGELRTADRRAVSTLPSRGEPGGFTTARPEPWLTPCSPKPPSTRG